MIIGLCGLAGSGKDTVAEIINRRFGYEHLAFADPIRLAMYDLDPIISRNLLEPYIRLRDAVNRYGWDDAKRKYPEIRRLMQVYGTEVCRSQNGFDYFTNKMEERLELGTDYVISDVRFPNEVHCIHRNGGHVVWVDRPGVARMSHASEQLDFHAASDAVIRNDGDMNELELATAECVRELIYVDGETNGTL